MKSLIEIPKTMKALVLHEIGKLTLDEVPVEPLRPGTVLVKIKACGICSSDVERVFINGTYHFPTIPGHEFSGQIVAVGDDVDESLLGRRTCVFPMLPCFECPSCKKQQYAQCSHYDYFGSRRMEDMQNIWLFRPGIWCCLMMICPMMWQQCVNRLR